MTKTDIATFANGCFWGTEHMYRKYFTDKGLLDVKVGFIGGRKDFPNPTYRDVCTGKTGYAEAAQLVFDPSQVSYAELVEFFYRTHDPTQMNGQGPDMGTQYRSALFPHTDEQEATAKKVTEEVQALHFQPKGRKIVTQIQRLPAEDLYVSYLTKCSGGGLSSGVPDQQSERVSLPDTPSLVVGSVTSDGSLARDTKPRPAPCALRGPQSRSSMSAMAHRPVVGTGLGVYSCLTLASCCTVVSVAGVLILSVFGWGFTHNWEAFMGSTEDPENGVAAGMTCYGAAFVYLIFIVFCVCQIGVNRRYQRIQI